MKLIHSVSLSLLICVGSACQSYRDVPLDLGAHWSAMESRDLSMPQVAEYAQGLSRSSTTAPVAYDPSDGLSLAEAEAVALFFNPQLRVARLRANVARVGAAEAGRWADPELAIDAERIVESVDEPWVLGGMLNVTIPLSGRLGAERRQVSAEATVQELRALMAERTTLAELREQWLEWSAALERAALARQFIEELGGIAERGERLRQAGELDPVDARLLQLERVKQTARLRQHEADARTGETRVKALLGLVPWAQVKLLPSLSVPDPQVPAEDQLPRVLGETSRVRVARAEYEVAERTLKLEITRQYPDLTLGGGYGTDEGDERVLLGAALPLPLFNANRRAIAEAVATREAARAAAEAEYEQVIGELAAARVRLDSARDRVRYVEEELAPLADQQVEGVRRLAAAGEFNSTVLLEALRTAHEAKLEVLDARLAAGAARVRADALLDTATAQPISPTERTAP